MKLILPLLLVLASFNVQATDPEDEVLLVVNQLFEGMRRGDSTMVREVFTDNARLITISEKENQPDLKIGSVDRFVTAVGTPHDGVWDEPIWDEEVRIDGMFAQVWAKYALYVGDKFIHCGVDAFHLFNGKNGWKIFQLTDTRQKVDCEFPPDR